MQNNAPAFVLEVPMGNLLTSIFNFVPCNQVVQRVSTRSHGSKGRRGLAIFFLSLKKEIIKMKGAGVEPRPLALLAGVITTILSASRLLKLENCQTVKRYPYYFIRTNRE